jgi:hypothetical protein
MDSRSALKALCEVSWNFHETFFPYLYSEYTLRAAYLQSNQSNDDIRKRRLIAKCLSRVETFSVNTSLIQGSSTLSVGAEGPFDGPEEATFARTEQFVREKLKHMTGIRSFYWGGGNYNRETARIVQQAAMYSLLQRNNTLRHLSIQFPHHPRGRPY